LLSSGRLSTFEEPFKALRQLVTVKSFTFPNGQYAPAQGPEFSFDFLVSADVLGEFCAPKLRARFGRVRKATVRVTMPEASVHLNGHTVPGQRNVRFARQIATVKPKPITQAVEQATDGQFGLSIPLTYARHHGTALGINRVCFTHWRWPLCGIYLDRRQRVRDAL
jgi:hypothetical protein